jgi:hypothetical protein
MILEGRTHAITAKGALCGQTAYLGVVSTFLPSAPFFI